MCSRLNQVMLKALFVVLLLPGVVRGQQAVEAPDWHQVDQALVMALLDELPTNRAGYRSPEDVAGLQQTEELVLGKLEAMGLTPHTQEVERPDRFARLTPEEAPTPRNIWVDLHGEGESADEWLVLMAHMDAVVGSPGADDNGTGVVALLEAARLLKNRPRQRSVRLLFTTLEEIGLVGARHHVTEHIEPAVDRGEMSIFGAVSLEMLGYYSDEPGSQRSPLPPMEGFQQPDRGNFLAILGVKRHQPFTKALAAAMEHAEPDADVVRIDMFVVPPPDLMRSDHAEFLIRGWPGAMLTDTANFRNPHYHTPGDTADTLDPMRFARAVSQVIGAADELLKPAPAEAELDKKHDAETP